VLDEANLELVSSFDIGDISDRHRHTFSEEAGSHRPADVCEAASRHTFSPPCAGRYPVQRELGHLLEIVANEAGEIQQFPVKRCRIQKVC